MKEHLAMQGIVTVENPFRVSKKGIDFRNKPYMTMNDFIHKNDLITIMEALNRSYELGFEEGQDARNQILKK